MIAIVLSLFGSLFSVVNPLGAMPVFLAMTQDATPIEKRKIVLKTGLYLIIILLVSYFGGNIVMRTFGISLTAMKIAGGIIIFSSGWALMQGKFAKNRAITKKVKAEAKEKEDISLTPLAMPMLAGPGSISLLIGWFTENHEPKQLILVTVVILITAIATIIALLVAPRILKYLGESGFKSMSRLLGFIVMSIGAEYIIGAVSFLWLSLN
jgi:MarC family membrane protein